MAEDRRCGDLIWGQKNHGCFVGEGTLIRERGEKETECECKCTHRVQGVAQEEHVSQTREADNGKFLQASELKV